VELLGTGWHGSGDADDVVAWLEEAIDVSSGGSRLSAERHILLEEQVGERRGVALR